MKTQILFIVGTRPEAIKMAPLILSFQKECNTFDVKVLHSGQHPDIPLEILNYFSIKVDKSLQLDRKPKGLNHLHAELQHKIGNYISSIQANWVFVQGDTASTHAGALSAFLLKVPIAHIEAGLRTYNPKQPFPEEIFRQNISNLASLHYPPSEMVAQHLIREGVNSTKIKVSGNTGIDALLYVKNHLPQIEYNTDQSILVTIHRRENQGETLLEICKGIEEFSKTINSTILFIMHPNPAIQKIVKQQLGHFPNIQLLPPQKYQDFIHLQLQSQLIITDSGGIQEEAPFLGKKVLVVRKITERTEVIGNHVILAEPSARDILKKANLLINLKSKKGDFYPYGKGQSTEIIKEHFLTVYASF